MTIVCLDQSRTLLFFPLSKQLVKQEVSELFARLPLDMNKQQALIVIQDFTVGKKFTINDNNEIIQIIPPVDHTLTWSWTMYSQKS